MSYVWKRLTRVNKKAAKYRVLFELQELVVEGTTKWQPNRLCVVLTRRNRRRCSQSMPWESTILNPYRGRIFWNLPEIIDIEVTLFKGRSKEDHYESKEWLLSIEDISPPPLNRCRRIASIPINISAYVDELLGVPSTHEFFQLACRVTSKKVKEVNITFMMQTQLLREGNANDADMQSMASLLSMKPDQTTPNLDDDDFHVAEHSAETSAQISEMSNKFSELVQGHLDCDGLNEQDPAGNDSNGTSGNAPTIPSNIVDNACDQSDTTHAQSESFQEVSLLETVPTDTGSTRSLDADKVDTVEAEEDDDHNERQASKSRLQRTTSSLGDMVHEMAQQEDMFAEIDNDHADGGANLNGHGSNRSSQSLSNIGLTKQSLESLQQFEPSPSLTVNDLLSWCQEVTQGYRGVKVTNMTTSWRNGMAFCAIIHHFRPDLIDFNRLRPSDVVDNCRQAFAIAERLGVASLINPEDMKTMNVPDKLSVMTYLYELRSYFTNASLKTPAVNKTFEFENEDNNSQASIEVQEKCLDLFTRLDEIEDSFSPQFNPGDGGKKNPKLSTSTANRLLDGYKFMATKFKLANNASEQIGERDDQNNSNSCMDKLMTRKQLMNPFDSDSDEEVEIGSAPHSKENIPPKNKMAPPIRKPLRFASQDVATSSSANLELVNLHPLPTSYSTSCFRSTNIASPSHISNSSNFEDNDQLDAPVEIVPGLIDLSQTKVSRLQRTFSAPTHHNLLVDSRKRSQCREQELRERARRLLQLTRSPGGISLTKSLSQDETERQRSLRERARKLIAEARQGVMSGGGGIVNWSSSESPISTQSGATTNSNNTPLMSPNHNLSFDMNPLEEHDKPSPEDDKTSDVSKVQILKFDFFKYDPLQVDKEMLKKRELNGQQNETSRETPTQLDVNNVTPELLKREFEHIEKQQAQIDQEAKILEKRLHKLMAIDGNKKLEEKLTQNWFILINKRNELLRKEMRLNIIKQQMDLNERYEALNNELRTIMALEDCKKTASQRAREAELLQELVQVVDKRDELERHLDSQEKAIEVDAMVEHQTQGPLSLLEGQDKNCVLQ